MASKLGGFIDGYALKARLYPAFLALVAPLLILVSSHAVYSKDIISFYSFSILTGVMFFLAEATRRLGKRMESKMYQRWDGPPTTRFLRHRDSTLDDVSKSRYKRLLGFSIGIIFPSADDEVSSPQSADRIYESSVRWLRENTRNPKRFGIIAHENVAFGFHRQCHAIRWIAVGLFVLSGLVVMISSGVIGWLSISPERLLLIDRTQQVALCVGIFSSFIWTLYFTESRVKISAEHYADALLRACDLFPQPPEKDFGRG